jgi:hypothetical protein
MLFRILRKIGTLHFIENTFGVLWKFGRHAWSDNQNKIENVKRMEKEKKTEISYKRDEEVTFR